MKNLPKVIFGTSALGNLYKEAPYETKCEVVKEILTRSETPALFDSAGKYGAGLALECLAQILAELEVDKTAVKISNKLGWLRTPLTTPEPTFEPGAWVNLQHDATQTISHQGIRDCFHQGNELLGGYASTVASIHDPDEYVSKARNAQEREERMGDVLEGYRALTELKAAGEIESIGIGSKDTSIIAEIKSHVKLDWAMFACSITPYSHEQTVIDLLKELGREGVTVINSAVFNAGFLVGGEYFDYRIPDKALEKEKYLWRDAFHAACARHQIKPAEACVQFSFLFSEIQSVALNTSSPKRVADNIAMANKFIPQAFWDELREEKLIHV